MEKTRGKAIMIAGCVIGLVGPSIGLVIASSEDEKVRAAIEAGSGALVADEAVHMATIATTGALLLYLVGFILVVIGAVRYMRSRKELGL